MGTTAVNHQGLYTAHLVRRYFPQSAWVTMVAVADAESTFNPLCINASSGTTGLFQIKYWIHGITKAQALNAQTNTKTAARLYAQSGLAPWKNDGYGQFMGIAQTLINRTAPVRKIVQAPVIVVPATFRVTGTARITPTGVINGALKLTAQHGTVHYTVKMWVTPTYNTTHPTSVTTTGSATNTTVTVRQSLDAPMPSAEIIRAYQQQHTGTIPFTYTINWSVSNGTSTKTVSGGKRVTLLIS